MNLLYAFLAPIGLLASGPPGVTDPIAQPSQPAAEMTERQALEGPAGRRDRLGALLPEVWWTLFNAYRPNSVEQVRIEQRVIVRISPRRGMARSNLSAPLSRRDVPTRFEERPMADCLNLSAIAGVRAEPDRLLLFLRDRRLVSATLEKTCSPSDYYAGFYLERNEDGRLCVSRDKLLARTGAKCEVSRLTQLVRASR